MMSLKMKQESLLKEERELASEVDGAKTSAALIVFEREALGK